MSEYRKVEYATWLRVHKRMTDSPRGKSYPAILERLVKVIGVVVASTLLLAGCVREPSRFVSATDDTLYDLCLTASDRWYDATGIQVDCLYGRSDQHTPMRWGDPGGCRAGSTDEDRILIHEPDHLAECKGGRAWTDEEGAVILETVVTHEMGHVIAGGHRGHSVDGAMARVTTPGAPIDESTLEWLCSAVECAWREAE